MTDDLCRLKEGVRHMSYGDPDYEQCVQASDVVQWAIDEIARLRLTDAEREAVEVACQDLRHTEEVATLRGLLERTKPVEK